MLIIEPSHEFITPIAGQYGEKILQHIELAARTCYKSEAKITDHSASDFVKKLIQVKKHESVIEHVSITIRVICDRGVSHELVRHRIASYSQESTRYCNYNKESFGHKITVIRPLFWQEDSDKYKLWKAMMLMVEKTYLKLLSDGASPQEARSVLPNSLKTELVITANLREWRHILRLRCSKEAHPQMRQLMLPILNDFNYHLPEIFDDIYKQITQ